MVKITRLFCVLVLCLFGIASANAENKAIALDPGIWDAGDATERYAAWVWKGTDPGQWVDLVENGGAYTAAIPDGMTGLVLARMNGETTENSWEEGTLWNQTGDIDLTAVADNSVIAITGWGQSDYTIYTLAQFKTQLQEGIRKVDELKANSLAADIATAQAAADNAAITCGDLVAAAIQFRAAVKAYCNAALEQVIPVAEQFNDGTLGEAIANAKAVKDNSDASAEDLVKYLKALTDAALPIGNKLMDEARAYFTTFDPKAGKALEPYFKAVEDAIEAGEYRALRDAALDLYDHSENLLAAAIKKVEGYAVDIDNETLNADLSAIKGALAFGKFGQLLIAMKKYEDDFIGVVAPGYLAKVNAMDLTGRAGADAVTTAKEALEAALKASTKDIWEIAKATRDLVKAVRALGEANYVYTVAGTKNLTGTEEDWALVDANNMTLNEQTGLYEWKAENITVSNDVMPEFKVVRTDAAGNEAWYPEGDGSTNWVITPDYLGGEGEYTITITFDPANNEIGVTGVKKAPVVEDDPVKEAPEGWTLAVTNGNLAGDDVSSYAMKDATQAQGPAVITAGAGKNGSRGIVVKSADETEKEGAQAWDTQFWIVLNEAVPAGTKVHVEFDYMASQAAKASTQAHGEPGAYQHWAAIGEVNFTTEWQTFSTDIEVNDAMAKGDGGNGDGVGLLSIAFNLQEEKSATDYHFDNFGVWYQKPAEPVEITSMAIVGDFIGGEPTEEEAEPWWNPANGWQMEQDAENPAIWTLTKPFTAEAKTYQYKATANGKWGDYELPAEGNYNFEFGTEGYPAGDYNLVFTADTENNTLDLVVKPSTVLTFTATFTTNAYWWDDVYAYAWSGEGENVTEYLGAWPGTKLKVNADGVYTVAVEGEVAPEKIIFNNGNSGDGNQTEDLTFAEGEAYQYVFNPTFDFENNNGQWAEGTTTFTMDDITLTGVTNAKYTDGQLRIGNRKGNFKLTAPEGKAIVKMEFKALKTGDFNLTPSAGEVVKTKELTQGTEESIDIVYSIWTWTGNGSEVSFDLSGALQRNLGFINVTLEDASAIELGDVNADGEVTTTDAVMAVDFALEKSEPTEAQFKAADVNLSNDITVSDAVGIVNIALEIPEENQPAGARMDNSANYLTMNGQTVSLVNTTGFVGFQMDVTLAEGTQFNGVQLSERAAGLKVYYNRVGENTWRIVALSLQRNTISGNEGALLTFDITGNGNIAVSNIEFADAAARAHVLGFDGDATGISGVSGISAGVDIYNVNGVRNTTMRKGMNIIRNANGEVKKMFVK